MEKTIKELANELGVSKQRVYRFIQRNHITEAHQEGQVKWYDEAAQSLVRAEFSSKTASDDVPLMQFKTTSDDAVLSCLMEQLKAKDAQLESKDRQIAALTVALENTTSALTAAQALHAGSIKLQLASTAPAPEPEPEPRRSHWGFGKKEKHRS